MRRVEQDSWDIRACDGAELAPSWVSILLSVVMLAVMTYMRARCG